MSANEIEARAKTMGWMPKEKFVEVTGQPEDKWVDAEAYVERGESIMPILKANNRKLSEEVSRIASESAALKAQLAEASETIEALKDLRTTLNVDRAKSQKAELLEAIKEAKTEGDIDKEVALTDKLSEVNVALKEASKPPAPKTPTATAPVFTPEAKAWQEANPWFGNGPTSDPIKTGAAMGLAQQWRAQGKTPGTKEFFDHVDSELGKIFDQNAGRRERPSKVDGAGNSDSSNSGSGDKRTFDALPPDVKAAFEKQAKKLVGPKSVYKTRADLQKIYVDQYDWS